MLKFLVPSFIKNLDKTLVLNYPFWYIVKLHYIIYFTAIMWTLSYITGSFLPIDISSYNPENVTNIWIFLFSVISVILFCIWMYYLTIYNNEDYFGKFTMWDDVKFLVALIIGINLLMSFSYPMQVRVKTRLANTFSDEALAKQYNDLNLGHKYINSNLDNYQYCGYNIHEEVDITSLTRDTDEYGEIRYVHDLSKYNRFIIFSPDQNSNYNFQFSNFFWGFGSKVPSSEFEHSFYNEYKVEQEYANHKTEAQKLSAIKNYFEVLKLYQSPYSAMYGFVINNSGSQKYTPQDFLDNYNHYKKECTTYFPDAYNLTVDDKTAEINHLPYEDVSPYINNIYQAKFETIYLLKDSFLIFAFYFSFFLSILVILFRNNRWQHYLVAVVSFILIAIFLGLFSLIIGHQSEDAFFSLSILTWITAGVIGFVNYFKNDKYRVVASVATMLFYVVLPIMPLVFCVYFHEVFDWLKCFADYNDQIAQAKCEINRLIYKDAIMYAQIFGIGGFIIIAMPFYKLYFAKQKALPRDK